MIIHDEYTIECLKSHLPAEFQPQLVIPCKLDPARLIAAAAQLPEDTALAIANCLKIGVEHTADGDPDLAFELADTIIQIGQAHENGGIIGLGMMARGDIMAHSGKYREAWDQLEWAGRAYLEAKDEIGWARTRIGRLGISSHLGQISVDQAFIDAERAEEYFLKHERYDRLLRLYHNWAVAYVSMGNYEKAITLYQRALETGKQQGDFSTSRIIIAYLHNDIGSAYNYLGEVRAAVHHLSLARKVLLEAHLDFTAALTGFGLANNYVIQGHYRQALHLLLNSVLPNLKGHRANAVNMAVIDCYLALNQNQAAYDLARKTVDTLKLDPNGKHQTALSALLLAAAQTRLGLLDDAQDSLDLAESNFSTYENMISVIQLQRAQIALRQGDLETARSIAQFKADEFQSRQQTINLIDAVLLGAETALLAGDLSDAQEFVEKALSYARKHNLLPVRYRCYVLFGQIFEKCGKEHSGIRMYQAALAVLRRIEKSLSISFRHGFLEDKLLPFHRLMHLYLSQMRLKEALQTLEQLKSRVFSDYLSQRETLHWEENERTRPLLDQLYRLRDKYRWLIRFQMSPPLYEEEASDWYREVASYANLQSAISDCEQQIRAITEKLYLFSEVEPRTDAQALDLNEVQRRLDPDTALLQFYMDAERVWCFGVTSDDVIVCPGSIPVTEIQQLIENKWLTNLDFALHIEADAFQAKVLTTKSKSMGERLYQMLLAPAESVIKNKRRLIIVPYGFLHQLPFNILRKDNRYLIETHEIVTLPSASLLFRASVQREAGALVVAHSWDGRLSQSIDEGHMVHTRMGGELSVEQEAHRDILQKPPRKVLHISTHGQHRIDQPDFSYVEFGDGPVYTDDLLQCDLSYELVVLSACEVGRAKVTASEELIGLGRGFLYAGAGALITSLWRVNERYTYQLMDSLYQALQRGDSKAAGLRAAQCELLSRHPDLHPAFWAAFQLICNPDPLTTT